MSSGPARTIARVADDATPARGDLERVAYEIAMRALGQQEAALNELRSRAGTLLAAASIAASFIGGQALHRVGFDAWTIAALAVFAVTLVACLTVLWPRDGLIFALSGPDVYERLYPFDMAEAHRRLAYWAQYFRDDNQATIGGATGLTMAYRVAVVGTIGQVMLWGAALAL